MRPPRLILDGLWQCLCPSFNINTLSRSCVNLSGKRRPKQLSLSASNFASPISTSQRRCRSGFPPRSNRQDSAQGDVEPPTTSRISSIAPGQDLNDSSQRLEQHDRDRNLQQPDSEAPGSSDATILSWRTPGVPGMLAAQPTSVLEAKLRRIASRRPNVQNTMQILRILIRDRHIQPEAWHYKALIQSNSDPRRGSPVVLRQLLAEMESSGLPADSGTLHAALQALAVHPDYLLRQDIVRTLRDRWLPLSPDGWHYVVAGLIREHQFELALDHISHMERKDIQVESWLHSLLVYYLCEFAEFDQVLQLMRSRVNQGHDMTLELWRYVLDVASTGLHHETTLYIWERMVELGYLHPSHELCSKVLAVASSEGDTDLAASVIRFLSQNNIPLEREDYEQVSGAHLAAGNLYAAFEALCEMHYAGVALQPSSTQPILDYALQAKSPARDIWSILKKLKAAGLDIPLGCARVAIEICEHGALNDPFEVDDGVAFYKELYTMCRERPDTTIYNTLISMCRRAKNTESGMFIVKEMAACGVLPDATTFESLTLMCLESGNFESAYMYFHDLLERGFHPSDQARAEIRELSSELNDKFAVQLRYHPEISEGLVRSPADELTAERGAPLFQKVSTTPTGEMADLHQRVHLRELQREEAHQEHLRRTKEARRQYNKERRKRKRRAQAIAKAQEEDDWMDYEPGGLIPEDQSGTRP